MTLETNIKTLYPEIDHHGIDLRSDYDPDLKAWRVCLKKGRFVLNTLLEPADVDRLNSGRPCLSLTVELQTAVDAITLLKP